MQYLTENNPAQNHLDGPGSSLRMLVVAVLVLGLALTSLTGSAETQHDLVILNGRVIDPDSGLDAIRHLGVIDGRIATISQQQLSGRATIDATDKVVAPGFLDLHSHSATLIGQEYRVYDGVTSSLELEAGAYPLAKFAPDLQAGAARINFGASAGYLSIRMRVIMGIEMPYISGSPRPINLNGYWTGFKSLFGEPRGVFEDKASADDITEIKSLLEQALADGSLGIGLALDYISEAVSEAELAMIFATAAENNAPIIVHIRRGLAGDISGLEEVITMAEQTGASVHVCHIGASAMGNIENFLALIAAAQLEEIDITTEVYPYTAGSTTISAAVFNRNWQEIFAINYQDVEWAETGERLTKESWERYREEDPHGNIIHHYGREEWTRVALADPGVIIASDAMPVLSEDKGVHPRTIGTFSRVLGYYARDERLLTLHSALAKMTILPARRMEQHYPVFARKGRLQVGADADIVIFDADRIIDKATYQNPLARSSGVSDVVVGGQPVVLNGVLQNSAYPGKLLLGGVD
jgi:N-acyl-D-aspartate/D-glutamate deacylase